MWQVVEISEEGTTRRAPEDGVTTYLNHSRWKMLIKARKVRVLWNRFNHKKNGDKKMHIAEEKN